MCISKLDFFYHLITYSCQNSTKYVNKLRSVRDTALRRNAIEIILAYRSD